MIATDYEPDTMDMGGRWDRLHSELVATVGGEIGPVSEVNSGFEHRITVPAGDRLVLIHDAFLCGRWTGWVVEAIDMQGDRIDAEDRPSQYRSRAVATVRRMTGR